MQPLKYIKDKSDQLRILKSCHIDVTSGHLGVKKTAFRIKERFMWKGIWNDVNTLVSFLTYLLLRLLNYMYITENNEFIKDQTALHYTLSPTGYANIMLYYTFNVF